MAKRRIPHFNQTSVFSLPVWQQIALALLGVVVALIVTMVTRSFMAGATLVSFLAATAFAAYVAGIPGAFLASIASYLLVEYFFVAPFGQLFPTLDRWPRAIFFVVVSVFLGWLQQQWRRAWEAQARTTEELESILATAADGVVILDRDLKIQYANPQAQRLLGLSKPLAPGSSLLTVLNEELGFCDEAEAELIVDQLSFSRAVNEGKLVEALVGCGAKSTPISRWITIKASPLLEEDGRVKAVVAIITDSSASRRSLKRAQEERNRLRTIFNVLSDAVIVSDAEGSVTMLNPAAERMVGWTQSSATSHMIAEVYQLEPAAASRIVLEDVFEPVEESYRLPQDTRLRTKDDTTIPVAGSVVLLPERTGKLVILRDLREEQLLERQRVLAEQRLREMINHIVCQVALFNPEGEVVEYNGYDVAGLTHGSDGNGVPPNTLETPVARSRVQSPAFREAFSRALQGESMRFDLDTSVDSEGVRTFDTKVAPLYGDDNQIANIVVSAVEITDRKQAQATTAMLAALVNTERKRLRDILESIPALVWESVGIPGVSHHVTFVNHFTETLLGYTMEEWATREHPWESIMHPEDLEAAIGELQSRYHGRCETPNAPIQFRVYTKDGTVLSLEMRVVIICDDDGAAQGIRGIAVDITAQKDAERRIGQLMQLVEIARARLQDTLDAVPAMVWEAVGPPTDQEMVFVSNYAERLTGYTPDEWIAEPNLGVRIIVPDDRDQALEVIKDNYYNGAGLPVHYRMRTKRGDVRWVEARVSIVKDHDENPVGVRGVTMDVTDLRLIEAELRRSNEDLQRFAYVASHDLQEPLRMVTSYMQLIEQRYADQLDEQAHEFIGFAVGGATRMKQLITDLLAYSRVQSSPDTFEPVDTAAIVETAIENLQSMLEDTKGVVHVGPLPVVPGNAMLLTQLFQNLINNAIKFRGPQPPEIHIEARERDAFWEFSIRDNGIGFEPRYADRIFVLFQRLHAPNRYAGTGIGLAICKKVVENHFGEIWVESEPGKGTTFFFTLPASAGGG